MVFGCCAEGPRSWAVTPVLPRQCRHDPKLCQKRYALAGHPFRSRPFTKTSQQFQRHSVSPRLDCVERVISCGRVYHYPSHFEQGTILYHNSLVPDMLHSFFRLLTQTLGDTRKIKKKKEKKTSNQVSSPFPTATFSPCSSPQLAHSTTTPRKTRPTQQPSPQSQPSIPTPR